MNKIKLASCVLAAGLLLAGCGGETSYSEDSGSVAVEAKAALKTFVNKLSENNVTVISSGSKGSKAKYYFGPDAFFAEDASGNQSGIIVAPYSYTVDNSAFDTGFFYFGIEDNQVVLESCAGLGNDVGTAFITPIFLCDKNIRPFYDYENATIQQVTDKNGRVEDYYLFTFDTETLKDEPRSLAYICALFGFSTEYYQYVSRFNMLLAKDGLSATYSLTCRMGASNSTQKLQVFDLGSTKNTAIEAFIKNPTTRKSPTTWSESGAASIKNYYAQYQDNLVFPTGIVNGSFDDGLIYNDAGTSIEGFSWTTYGEDLGTQYSTILKNNGYEFYTEQSSESSSTVYQIYRKVITPQNLEKRTPGLYMVCQFGYTSNRQLFSAAFYPNQFGLTYEFNSISEFNPTFKTVVQDKQTSAQKVVSLPESASVKKIELLDNTVLSAISSQYKVYSMVTLSIASEKAANEYVTNYIDMLKEQTSYKMADTMTWDTDGAVDFAYPDLSKPSSVVQIIKGTDANGAYSGQIVCAFMTAKY